MADPQHSLESSALVSCPLAPLRPGHMVPDPIRTMFELQVVRLPLVAPEGIQLWLGQAVPSQALADGWLQVGDLQAGTCYY